MKAASLFVIEEKLEEGFMLQNESYSTVQTINEVEESLTTQLFVNESTNNGYKHCVIVADEIVDVVARALQKNITQIIVQNSYDVYFKLDTGELIVLSGRKIADRAKELFQEKYNLNYSKHEFDMEEIINTASNVKGARFKDLTIQTIRNGVLSGNRVDETELYELMLQSGTLYNTTVSYPFGINEVTFSISNSGSIVLFSNLEDVSYLDLINDLSNL